MESDKFLRREGQTLYSKSGSDLDLGPVRRGDLVHLVTKTGKIFVTVLDVTDINAIIGTVSNLAQTNQTTLNEGDVVTFSENEIHMIRRTEISPEL